MKYRGKVNARGVRERSAKGSQDAGVGCALDNMGSGVLRVRLRNVVPKSRAATLVAYLTRRFPKIPPNYSADIAGRALLSRWIPSVIQSWLLASKWAGHGEAVRGGQHLVFS